MFSLKTIMFELIIIIDAFIFNQIGQLVIFFHDFFHGQNFLKRLFFVFSALNVILNCGNLNH